MKNSFIIILFLLSFLFAYSQNETNNWHFGEKGGINFNLGNLTVLTDSKIEAPAGSASISDPNGNLLFYTNGVSVWNKNNDIMEGGTGLAGEINNTQSSLIIPKPNSNSVYYIFTTRKESSSGFTPGLYYSEVEISTSFPNGKVTNKNITLANFVTEKITAVHHTDGNSIWLLAFGSKGNTINPEQDTFRTYKITASAIEFPKTYQIDTLTEKEKIKFSVGTLKISPNGKKIALADFGGTFVYLFDFNPSNGAISFIQKFGTSPGIFVFVSSYGLEFSQDSKNLYFAGDDGSQDSYVYQYLFESPLLDKRTQLSFSNNFNYRSMQLASNGQIYITKTDKLNPENEFLDVIRNPEKEGEAVNYESNFLNISPGYSKKGLPNFIQSYFRNRIITENKCVSENFNFSIDAYTTITSVTWSFGDGTTSTEMTPSHLYAAAGEYTVKATITFGGSSTTLFKKIEVFPLPIALSGKNLKQCDTDNDGKSLFDLTDIKPQITDSGNELVFYKNSTDFNSNSPILNPDNFENESNPQEIIVAVFNKNGCSETTKFSIETLFVQLNTIDNIYACDDLDTSSVISTGIFSLSEKRKSIQRDLSIPSSTTLRFYASSENAQLTKDELPDMYTSATKTIWVRADNALGCGGIQSFKVIVNSQPIINLQENYTICYNPSLKPAVTISAEATNNSFEWKNSSGIIQSTAQNFTLVNTGVFSLTVYKTENGIECTNTQEFTVKNPDEPAFSNITVNTEDETNSIVDVEISGNSTYEFSLDNINFFSNSTSYTFTKVVAGLKTIYVRDINTCENPIQQKVSVLGVKDFFTPNNDGKNDYWNINGLDAQFYKSINIKIFDRLGRVVCSITDFNTPGWDGTFNGKMQISNTYWFKVEIIDIDDNVINKTGHFSLIRK
ncbi:T9SS type B sorting domain-containing protein [Polaribacter sp. IC073]|uniref:T9SS type B sorting domain-containing protein n=1 Tax=Polaribacter sp. IC073 TaxID=2508540 RepID=UPI0011BEAF71|nr:T9SS type B sorting domain-containing protein [Polaribacter sp. IC073]TXD48298.1 T9SS type B sorting domain-containing protein [Polaribacter sp. IC073]